MSCSSLTGAVNARPAGVSSPGQGYLADKKTPYAGGAGAGDAARDESRGTRPMCDPRHRPTVRSYGVAVS